MNFRISLGVLRYFLLLTFICHVGITQAASQTNAVLTDKTDRIKLSLYMDVLEDPQRELDIHQVSSSTYAIKFIPNKQLTPNFGRSHSAYWIRFTLYNQSDQKWYARINALLGHDVTLYVLGEDGKNITGDIASYLPNHGAHAWSLALTKQKKLTFYIRATNGGAIFSLPIELFSSDDFVEQTRLDYILYASIIAALLMMAVYNLLSFFMLRESSYAVLAIHIVSVAAIVQITNPIYAGLEFLKNTDSHFFTAPIYIAVISFLVFCQQLLQTSSSTPILDRLITWVTFISVGLIFITGWIPSGKFLPQLMFVSAFFLVMIASIVRSLQGYRIAKYFLAIFLIIIFMVIPNAVINVVSETDWQSDNFPSTGIATLMFLLLLSVVQSEKIRGWREQKQKVAASKEATDSFLMTISHELRTPMQALIGIGELLKKTPLNLVQKDYLNKQEYASQHMLTLVNDILEFGAMNRKGQAFEREYEALYLQKVFDELSQLLSFSAEKKGLKLIVHKIPSDCPPLLGDVKHLKQVLLNLLDNAIKYTEQGIVTLKVNLHKDRYLPFINILFEVSDTGAGVPVNKQLHLFEPFFQINPSDRQYGGSGLGLAISHRLVKLMGGELQVRGMPKTGTCFFFTLKLSTQEERQQAKTTRSKTKRSSEPLRGVRILFVEDDDLNQLIGQKLLIAKGAAVLLAATGHEAISQIKTQACDIVLMDLDLPDMNGYEATKIILADKNIPSSPIIALTAHAIGGEREKCLQAGMDDYLAKPYNIDELVDIVLKHHRPIVL